MAKQQGTVALLMVASLLVAVTLADARFTVHRNELGAFVVSQAATPKVPALNCHTVHAVRAGETCFSVATSAKLTQEQFLGFNPNINCETVFVGQWVCLAATSA